MKRITKGLLAVAVAVALVGGLALSATTVEAQGGRGGKGWDFSGAGLWIGVCSTTDYTSVAAQALNMTPTELRVALAGGASLTRIAAQKGVDITTVQEALRTARLAEVDQALADGLITAAQAEQLKALLNAQPQAPMMPGLRERGKWFGLRIGRVNFPAGVSARNTVKPYPVAAQALGMSCADLVKALQGGQSIAQVAASKGVALQTVVDALSKAYGDALTKDVEEGLVAPARAEALRAQIVNNVLGIVSRPHARLGIGVPHIGRDRRGQFFGEWFEDGELGEHDMTFFGEWFEDGD
ncbi:MAG: hypothetical protein CUN49_06320 [Candidatus Thermofonsia Clade 1 bacterium]|uniref:LysM domain-containing protein n=1 Tax=Candidatus Thermofonsia Clade 1 bacterium TaxID=2364210 RepID=A0A2M8PFD3_9CHLR|nr:MAG: hypothetical protein CUN49_06320 [Candidatus Thermofonsia Clade 1 bacterium]RMF53773.1 MAG: hypothetical protein D6749_01325 [Chloroflexota bacterium]